MKEQAGAMGSITKVKIYSGYIFLVVVFTNKQQQQQKPKTTKWTKLTGKKWMASMVSLETLRYADFNVCAHFCPEFSRLIDWSIDWLIAYDAPGIVLSTTMVVSFFSFSLFIINKV